MSDKEYFEGTRGYISAKVYGYHINNSLRSSDVRNLFTLMWNQNRGKGKPQKKADQLWPLTIDLIGTTKDPKEWEKKKNHLRNIHKLAWPSKIYSSN